MQLQFSISLSETLLKQKLLKSDAFQTPLSWLLVMWCMVKGFKSSSVRALDYYTGSTEGKLQKQEVTQKFKWRIDSDSGFGANVS